MRKPTSKDEAFKWWRDALAGTAPPPINEMPQCGFYQRRLVKGGPFVPAKIWLNQVVNVYGELIEPEELLCAVNGKLCNPVDQWGYLAGNPISLLDYQRLVGKIERDIREGDHAPNKPLNYLTIKPPSFKREN